jgi:hypothetical protein
VEKLRIGFVFNTNESLGATRTCSARRVASQSA